jgi:RimJ/RimL family protein N-acetyltransferase
MMDGLEIRYSELSDGKFLLRWMENEEVSRWYPPTGEKEIQPFVSNWIGFSKFHSSLTVLSNNQICGIGTLFLMPYRKVAHQCMLYMIVDPLFSENGIGDSLLKNMINLAKNYFKLEIIVAEVFEGSILIKLLEKYGFTIFAKQEGYIKENDKYLNKILYQLFL